MEKSGFDLRNEMRYPVPFVNSPLLPLLLLSLTSQKNSPKLKTTFATEYDYIVVGGGAAGSVVASRLSEIPEVTVLLLEAGKPSPLLTEVPSVSRAFVSDIGRGYRTKPQKHLNKNRILPLASGKVLGGSSVINGMIAVRGNRKNFDDWARNGATGWSYKEVLPYFKKLEDNRDPEYLSNGYHGIGGPVTVEKPNYDSKIAMAVTEAALNLGFEFVDVNGPTQTGFLDYQATIRNGQRCSTAKGYLVPAENLTNLDILTSALVTKIIIEDKEATGVLFDIKGYIYKVKARKEVIISAGAMKTPQLLMLSGIGPMAHLSKFKIPVIADLPVGLNLQNHCITFMGYEVSENIKNFQDGLKVEENIAEYIYDRSGPLSLPDGYYMIAFLNTHEKRPRVDRPEVTLYIGDFAASINIDDLDFSPEVLEKYFGPYRDKNTITCSVSNLNPRSVGEVTLKSRDPYAQPVIDPNTLADFRDVEDLVGGMKICRKLMSSPEMQKLGVKTFKNLVPGCEQFSNDDEHYLRCFVRTIIMEAYHVAGTAKMGHADDPTAVVDPQLRVKSIKGLRVVDASVMPKVTWGNTYLPTVMIAEKASDMIKASLLRGD